MGVSQAGTMIPLKAASCLFCGVHQPDLFPTLLQRLWGDSCEGNVGFKAIFTAFERFVQVLPPWENSS